MASSEALIPNQVTHKKCLQPDAFL